MVVGRIRPLALFLHAEQNWLLLKSCLHRLSPSSGWIDDDQVRSRRAETRLNRQGGVALHPWLAHIRVMPPRVVAKSIVETLDSVHSMPEQAMGTWAPSNSR